MVHFNNILHLCDLSDAGMESRWGKDFLHLSRPGLGLIQPPVQWVPGLPGGKEAGAWRYHHPIKRRG
jgi:hypothetical protein